MTSKYNGKKLEEETSMKIQDIIEDNKIVEPPRVFIFGSTDFRERMKERKESDNVDPVEGPRRRGKTIAGQRSKQGPMGPR